MPSSVAANGVTHLIWEQEGWLGTLLAPTFPDFGELLSLGAIYVNKVRVHQDTWISVGDYVRLHPRPRRFNIEAVDWTARIFFENDDFWVMNKPAGVPVHATVDNFQENLVQALSKLTGRSALVTHRIDTVTSGLVLLAKTPAFQRWFNRSLARKAVSKSYRALSSHPAPAGLWVHSMKDEPYAPKTLSTEITPESVVCETQADTSLAWGDGFETTLSPLTGRTHQLRAQMAFSGCPIWGDSLYGGEERGGFGGDRIALHAQTLTFTGPGPDRQEYRFDCPPDWKG
jgi:23S rRNA pseudouridine1911/1915/1917 synthase